MNDVLNKMEVMSRTFSKGQRRIAEYMLRNYDKAAFMTANLLGKTVGVSESTVVRFATELGYSGYPQMQKALQELVLNNLTSVQRMGVTNDRMGKGDLLSAVLQADAEKVRKTAETISSSAFQNAVDAMLQARRIYLIGVRSASTLANFMGYYLNYMFDSVHTVTASGTGEMFEKLVNVGKNDVVIAFSFPRYSSVTVKGAEYCRSVGATVIGLTNSSLSPLADSCDHLLLAKSDMVSVVDSLVAPLSVVNALIVALAAQREYALAQTFNTLEKVWDENHVYEKRVDNL
jgi:DNA-binding MurR/RpiR family transcriptional regulator